MLCQLRRLASAGANPFDRALLPVHATVSIRLMADHGRVAVIEHPRLGIPTYAGGHVESGESPAQAAVREAVEELGVSPGDVQDLTGPVAVGLHEIPATRSCRSHWHVDLLYQARYVGVSSSVSGEGIPWGWKKDASLRASYISVGESMPVDGLFEVLLEFDHGRRSTD